MAIKTNSGNAGLHTEVQTELLKKLFEVQMGQEIFICVPHYHGTRKKYVREESYPKDGAALYFSLGTEVTKRHWLLWWRKRTAVKKIGCVRWSFRENEFKRIIFMIKPPYFKYHSKVYALGDLVGSTFKCFIDYSFMELVQ